MAHVAAAGKLHSSAVSMVCRNLPFGSRSIFRQPVCIIPGCTWSCSPSWLYVRGTPILEYSNNFIQSSHMRILDPIPSTGKCQFYVSGTMNQCCLSNRKLFHAIPGPCFLWRVSCLLHCSGVTGFSSICASVVRNGQFIISSLEKPVPETIQDF